MSAFSGQSMIRKSTQRFSCSIKNLERDGDSTKSLRAPGKAERGRDEE
jgi:hypothetical protein